ncbi:conserved hypothetical protein [Pediculus humanus corporis]|uniref:hydroxyisourate hydrolase n=1 Tax=Pediculus humanus subsp. corporis TaxID=121224 RepID=E0VZQ4_PEDHC|nr:uncharacterized protein Phum_PHUM537320 [Pediculus humanus corporis]EEB18860.1 conserved hypothetical protein [Pediculus humanus corporis]
MADDCVQIVRMGDSSDDSEEKYEIYKAGSDMVCVIGVDNKQSMGKNAGFKPRYKQSYREAWESMKDFKGWLTSVPGNSTKAYCKLCKKELHCHRLSLLKHKVTFKHHKKEEEQKLVKSSEDGSKESINNTLDSKNEVSESSSSNESTIYKNDSENCDAEINDNFSNTLNVKENNSSDLEKKTSIQCDSGLLSTHVLDICKGIPAALIHVVLYKLIEGRWTLINEGLTGLDGRYHYNITNENDTSIGRYKLHIDIDEYFEKQSQETIFPFIEVAFDVKDASSHYHIPLLLTPFGYSTYKGS